MGDHTVEALVCCLAFLGCAVCSLPNPNALRSYRSPTQWTKQGCGCGFYRVAVIDVSRLRCFLKDKWMDVETETHNRVDGVVWVMVMGHGYAGRLMVMGHQHPLEFHCLNFWILPRLPFPPPLSRVRGRQSASSPIAVRVQKHDFLWHTPPGVLDWQVMRIYTTPCTSKQTQAQLH